MIKTVQCSGCGIRVTKELSDFDEVSLARHGFLTRACGECRTQTRWQIFGEADRPSPGVKQVSRGILLIGADKAKLRQITNLLEQCGDEAEIIASFNDALTMIARDDFELIIAEHRPPEFDARRLHSFVAEHRPEYLKQMYFIVDESATAEEKRLLEELGVKHWSMGNNSGAGA